MTYDILEVVVDFDDNTFTILRTYGAAQTYDLTEEWKLWNKIYDDLRFSGGFPVYSLSTENVDEYGSRYYIEE